MLTYRHQTMIRNIFQRLALILFCIYLAVLPGSTIVVALDRVPGWGTWMGGALLLLQGAAALCWLLGGMARAAGWRRCWCSCWHGQWSMLGVTTGMPFGRYHYTSALQPQFFGVVPLAIPCAWLMVAAGAWQLATTDDRRPTTDTLRLLPMYGRSSCRRWSWRRRWCCCWISRSRRWRPRSISTGSGAMAGHTTACRPPISWPGG